MRRAPRKRTKALLPSATPRTREIVRLMLATDWTMARIGAESGVPGQRVNEVVCQTLGATLRPVPAR